MTTLKELQENFQRGILAGDDAILSAVKDSSKEDREVLFGVQVVVSGNHCSTIGFGAVGGAATGPEGARAWERVKSR